MANDETSGVSVDLSDPELDLIVTALRFLLAAEDDPPEIERLTTLIERLSR